MISFTNAAKFILQGKIYFSNLKTPKDKGNKIITSNQFAGLLAPSFQIAYFLSYRSF